VVRIMDTEATLGDVCGGGQQPAGLRGLSFSGGYSAR